MIFDTDFFFDLGWRFGYVFTRFSNSQLDFRREGYPSLHDLHVLFWS